MLKSLVGLASIAIVAFVGYYFWGEWQRGEAAKAQEQAAFTAARAECLSMRDDLSAAMAGKDLGRRFVQGEAREVLSRCVTNGSITLADLGGIKL